uniref:Uncharacterized protein n=1 Tax=Romanomermis culicivorax TaxID=13658 RepID=A0A915JRF7_ROMCU
MAATKIGVMLQLIIPYDVALFFRKAMREIVNRTGNSFGNFIGLAQESLDVLSVVVDVNSVAAGRERDSVWCLSNRGMFSSVDNMLSQLRATNVQFIPGEQ